MGKWIYTLKVGPELREIIRNTDDTYATKEEIINLMSKLREGYVEILHNVFSDTQEDRDEFESYFEEIDEFIAELEDGIYDDFDFGGLDMDEVTYRVDYLLEGFYDFCDNIGVFVGL